MLEIVGITEESQQILHLSSNPVLSGQQLCQPSLPATFCQGSLIPLLSIAFREQNCHTVVPLQKFPARKPVSGCLCRVNPVGCFVVMRVCSSKKILRWPASCCSYQVNSDSLSIQSPQQFPNSRLELIMCIYLVGTTLTLLTSLTALTKPLLHYNDFKVMLL